MAGLHYATITNVAWLADAHYLELASHDGYCTLVEFENYELGSPIVLSDDRTCTTTNQNTSSTDAVTVNDDQNRKTEAEVKQEENKSIGKPDNIVIEKIADTKGHEMKKRTSKQVHKLFKRLCCQQASQKAHYTMAIVP
ncbi:chromatin assembly factor 1 subunit FAS2-like [Cucurbita maxima]|uniref:Chromatin assembly factor 1 subunit FAS2-like n=1 Tax=Cucurbita maxima TaxID=3661 RepID=A0A6J1KSM4_CUCMA|nr:chromatin assembly factor 1 subunit FAS2-like [Cucurbita maxima]